jgi:hypothetical protein
MNVSNCGVVSVLWAGEWAGAVKAIELEVSADFFKKHIWHCRVYREGS